MELNVDYKIVTRVLGNDGRFWSAAVPVLERSVEDYLNDGFTLVVNRVNERSRRVFNLCQSLTAFFGLYVSANLYVTPTNGKQGFALHHDPQDAFVIQLSGAKRWTICESWPLDAPLMSFQMTKPPSRDKLPRQCETLLLRAGDSLFIPRGVLHQASTVDVNHTTNDERSVHLTLGVESGTATLIEWIHYWIDFVTLQTQQKTVNHRSKTFRFLLHFLLRRFANLDGAPSSSISTCRHSLRLMTNTADNDDTQQQQCCNCLAKFLKFATEQFSHDINDDDRAVIVLTNEIKGLSRVWVPTQSNPVTIQLSHFKHNFNQLKTFTGVESNNNINSNKFDDDQFGTICITQSTQISGFHEATQEYFADLRQQIDEWSKRAEFNLHRRYTTTTTTTSLSQVQPQTTKHNEL